MLLLKRSYCYYYFYFYNVKPFVGTILALQFTTAQYFVFRDKTPHSCVGNVIRTALKNEFLYDYKLL